MLVTPQQQHTNAFSFLTNQSMPRALGAPAAANKRKYAGSSSSVELNQQVQHQLGMPMPQHITPFPNNISYQVDESSEDEDNVQQSLNPTEFMQQMLQFQAMKNLNEGKRKSKKSKARSMNFFRWNWMDLFLIMRTILCLLLNFLFQFLSQLVCIFILLVFGKRSICLILQKFYYPHLTLYYGNMTQQIDFTNLTFLSIVVIWHNKLISTLTSSFLFLFCLFIQYSSAGTL